jgi:hypothetical protein
MNDIEQEVDVLEHIAHSPENTRWIRIARDSIRSSMKNTKFLVQL